MKTYEQVLEIVELALARGEYHFCIEFLSPLIQSFPLSSKEGVNLRTILITALCGINKKEEAKKLCKELLKSHEDKTREDAKYFMEIIDSPEIKKPENWNIKFEKDNTVKQSISSLKKKNRNSEKKKFINVIDAPTGETKSFQKGFAIVIVLILLILIPLLSGCVKIENTLDLSEIDSIDNHLIVESKYIKKFPWQINFEDRIKDDLPDADISIDESNFYLIDKNLTLNEAKKTIQKIHQAAGDFTTRQTNVEFNTKEKNLIFLKKYIYKIDIDLTNISNIENLEIILKIIHPNKATFTNLNNTQIEIKKNLIVWNLIPGEINKLEFSFWSWNILFFLTILILILIIMAYVLRFYRFKLGTDLPQLPSE